MVRKALIERWRRDAIGFFQAAVQAVDPLTCVPRWVRRHRDRLQVGSQTWPLPERVWVVGAGKASARMAQALEAVLGDRIAGGLVVTKEGHGVELQRVSSGRQATRSQTSAPWRRLRPYVSNWPPFGPGTGSSFSSVEGRRHSWSCRSRA
jgi:hypothetical protein